MEPEFPSNSHNPLSPDTKPAIEEKSKKNVEKVVTGEVIQKPPSFGRRFKQLFSGGEAKGAARYIVAEVMLPALKNLIVDATSKGVERLVYGNAPTRRYEQPGRPRISYDRSSVVNQYARQPRGILPDQPPLGHRARRQNVSEIILAERQEAEIVLERLNDIIDKYDVASVADLQELCGLPSSHVDNKWGWSNLSYASIRQIREGYLIDLPPAEPLS